MSWPLHSYHEPILHLVLKRVLGQHKGAATQCIQFIANVCCLDVHVSIGEQVFCL